jgi:outer membrane protein TolC
MECSMTRLFSAIFLCMLLYSAQTHAADITALLDAAARQPGVVVSELAEQESMLRKEAVKSALYPKVNLFGKAEAYNSPTNLRPMPPTEVNIEAGDSIPFSREILRYGLSLEVPLYVKKLYVLSEKLQLLAEEAGIANSINLVTREAAVVSLNSVYQYLASLDKAIVARLKSLAKTHEDISLKVKNGRAPEAELIKIETSINDLEQQRNDLTVRMLDVRKDLSKLTGITVEGPVAMALKEGLAPGYFIEVKKAEKEVAAAQKEVMARRAARFPTLSLYGMVSGNDGQAYNTDSHIFRSYNFIGLALNFPLYDKTLTKDEEIARIQLKKSQKQLEEVKIELIAIENNLKEKLPIIDRSLQLAEQSVKNDEQLLAIARVAYNSGRMTTEEYLRYESQVLAAQSVMHKAVDERWQVVARQAVLYGTDLRGVVE